MRTLVGGGAALTPDVLRLGPEEGRAMSQLNRNGPLPA
jgi:hypothetical protein